MWHRLVVAVFAITLVGCAPQSEPSPPAVRSAVAVPDAERRPGAGELYIFNVSGWTLIPSNQEVTDNGVPLVSLPRDTYKKVLLTAGKHELRAVPAMPGRVLVLDVEEGRRYFVAAGYRPEKSFLLPLAGDPVAIASISEGDAQRLLSTFRAQ